LESRETQRTREEYDPSGVERSKQLEAEESTAPTGGVPGVQSNVTGGDAGKTQAETPVKKSSQVYNYEIGKTTSQTVEPRGQVRRLTVGVLIDGRYEGEKYIPRSPEEIDAVRSVVTMAAGLSVERGDKVEVVNIPFKTRPAELENASIQFDLKEWMRTPQGMVAAGGVVVLLLLSILFRKRRRARAVRMAEDQPALLQSAGTRGCNAN
jgi:flagellar M-ring protein FliF